ncbi:hypothetical protein [Aquimarina pacifica]|uniref:hypothetical protein n=1 Tax=Aquimarina pacifica TaxID=1296415 RepID=UPI0004719B76|nr:hypothetical protein [Aquimarina pacifica]
MSTENLTAEKSTGLSSDQVRSELKAKFDAKPTNDSSYVMYHMIDQNIPSDGTTKDDILRITQFFNALSFFESINLPLRDAYLEHNNLRYGFLSNGALFKSTNNGSGEQLSELYNMHELSLQSEETYNRILSEIDAQLETVDGSLANDSSGEKWYFWPGCEMKMPESTTILVDTSIEKSKFVVTKKPANVSNEATQIILEEKSYQLEISLLGDNEFFYNETNNAEVTNAKLKPGFFAINKSEPEFEGMNASEFSEIDLTLNKGEEYDFTLYIPYNSPRFDLKTHLKIYDTENNLEEFVATTT